MARGLITVKTSGLKEIVAEMEALGEHYDEILLESLKAMQNVIEDYLKFNVISMIGGETGAFIFDSIGQSSKYSQQMAHSVVGTVGVYHIDHIFDEYEKYKGDLNAPQLAYFIEFGTNRLNSGQRKKTGVQYSTTETISLAPKPFLSNAAYQTREAQNKAFIETFNRLADKYK